MKTLQTLFKILKFDTHKLIQPPQQTFSFCKFTSGILQCPHKQIIFRHCRLFSTALLNKNGLPPRSSPLSPPSLTAAALVSSASAPPRCSLRSLRHRPAAVHRIGDGAELEGPGPYWRSPRPGILPGPERGGGGALERGQREGCPRETLQGEHG